MFNWINFFQLEKVSFLIGFVTATIFWWIFTRSRKWWPELVVSIKKMRENLRKNQTSGVEIAIRKETLIRAQSNHIGSKLFSLREIFIEPQLLIPPHLFSGGEKSLFLNEVTTLVPYSPDVPIISRNFNVPKINISDAVQKGNNLAISAMPGSGKTFALAYLASCLADKNPNLGNSSAKIPFYFHVYDTDFLSTPEQELSSVIYKALSSHLSVSQLPKLARFISYQLESRNAIVIIDGLDELNENNLLKAIRFIEKAVSEYRGLQFIVSISPYFHANLEKLNFLILTVAAMSNSEIFQLQRKWIDLWYTHIFSDEGQASHFLKKDLLTNWVNISTPGHTPLENTLYIWGALSGEIRGNDTFSIYESIFSRIYQSSYSPDALAAVAIQCIDARSTALPVNKIEGAFTGPLLDWGIIKKVNDLIIFNHMDLLAFLASMSPKNHLPEESLEKVSRNPLDFLYQGYVSARNPRSAWVEDIISQDQPPLYYNLLLIGPWLRHVPIKSPWRINLFKSLLQIIQNPLTPFGIKIRLLSTFIYANDPSLGVFVKQLLSQNDSTFKHLALLLIGIQGTDSSFISELNAILDNTDSRTKKYVVLALSAFEDEQSFHSLATLLLQADEDIRKLVAECLSNMRTQGIDILRDAITLEDILVRRSAIFGLVNVDEFWVFDLLNKLSIEDSQWVVRNVAHQAVEHLNSNSKIFPINEIPFFEEEWLIQFAANQNLGISPDVNPAPILIKALISGNENEKINAMQALPTVLSDDPEADIATPLYDKNREISDLAIVMLWRIYQSGFSLPFKHPGIF